VFDQGESIVDDSQALLFRRFVQIGAKHRAATGGYWIGLKRCQSYRRKQGENMIFESDVGVGSTSHVDLPTIVLLKTVDDT
jgi:two-component system capsular synthesis sensor histidine kinase RcsC